MNKEELYLKKKIEEENKWIYEHFYCSKAIVLNILTGGLYGFAQVFKYGRRVGLL